MPSISALLYGKRHAYGQRLRAWYLKPVKAIIMDATEEKKSKTSLRKRADEIKDFRCKFLTAVIENPSDIRNIGTVIRNANALGVEKVYVIDPRNSLPDDWQDMRERKSLSKSSASAVKWTFAKRFDSTESCIEHLQTQGYVSIVTSPHVKGKKCIYLHEGDYTEHGKLAVWFGNETRGISQLAVEHAEMCVSVPMFGIIESLNLGTSSGIVLYEVTKQRRTYQSRFSRNRKRGERKEPLPTIIPRGQ